MLVQDIMASELATISPNATIADAAAVMLLAGTTSLFVTAKDFLLGIITDKDVLYGVVAKGFGPTDRKVWEFMTLKPPVANPGMNMLELVLLMDRHRLTKLPVVVEEKLVGSVTLADVAASLDLL
jgi:CBS domain-containing protein